MSHYSFSMTRNDSDDDDFGADETRVNVTFDTEDSLSVLVEKFYWFLQAVGFSYINEVKAGDCSFSG